MTELVAGWSGQRPTAIALGLLATALLVAGGRPGRTRWRAFVTQPTERPPGPVLRIAWIAVGAAACAALGWVLHGGAGALTGTVVALGAGFTVRKLANRGDHDSDDAELAAGWELLAVCLRAGLPVPPALGAAAEAVRGHAGAHLRRVAGLLTLGSDPAAAWRGVEEVPALSAFARAAGRSAATGAALAHVAHTEAERLRAELVDAAQARAQRAAVQITAPLGACFLPAFLVMGVAPVVIGLASEALARW